MSRVIFGDNLKVVPKFAAESADLIYLDPPFNTGKTQDGYGGESYKTEDGEIRQYEDKFEDYVVYIEPHIREALRLLKPNGSFYFHGDYREIHYCKVLIDEIFGRERFVNEIIWAYDYGKRTKKRWPAKHQNILFYVKDPNNYVFNTDDIDRIPYMAPGLVGKEKAEKGKLPTDTWWLGIVNTMSHEKLGYPGQKPVKLMERIIGASSPKGGLVLDWFGGSGTTGEAAMNLGREFTLVENNPQAIKIMQERFQDKDVMFEGI